jgi:NAD(P) transhydrogenase
MSNPTEQHYDLVVIGAGPAGQKGAVQAAKLKKSVVIVEKEASPGGICLYTGTLPSKTLRATVLLYQGFRKRTFRGISCSMSPEATLADLMYHKDSVIDHERLIISDQLSRNSVQVIHGHAGLLAPHRVEVSTSEGNKSVLHGDYLLIATGTRPTHPPYISAVAPPIYDSDTILQIKQIPRTLTVLGGGIIGCEYACMFGALGTKVTLVDRRKTLLQFMDDEIVAALCFHMRNMGITLKLGEEIDAVEVPGSETVVTKLLSGKVITSEALLSAAGRTACVSGMGLEEVGVSLTNGNLISVNQSFQTAVPHIYAAGDVIGFPSLASTSMDQGRIAVCHMFNHSTMSFSNLLPYGVYTIPEISVVGKTEQQLTEQSVPYETGVARFREIARGQILGETEGLLKLIFDRDTREVLGVHVIGEGATELVHIGQAVIAHAGKIDYFVNTVFNYPTLAEAYKVAALNGINKLQ